VADCTATAASNILGISRQTVTAYFDKCRRAYQQALQKDPIQFEAGGEYEVDETLFRRVRNNQGELVDVQWVAGILERDSGKVLLYRVPNRSHESLLPPIRSHIPQGCFLYSDELTTYHMLDQEYMHYAVNHSNKEYVREEDFFGITKLTVHCNSMEGLWKRLKSRLLYKSNRNFDRMDLILAEFMYRNSGRSLFDPFKAV
jgi:hypothetical protein